MRVSAFVVFAAIVAMAAGCSSDAAMSPNVSASTISTVAAATAPALAAPTTSQPPPVATTKVDNCVGTLTTFITDMMTTYQTKGFGAAEGLQGQFSGSLEGGGSDPIRHHLLLAYREIAARMATVVRDDTDRAGDYASKACSDTR